MLLVQKAEAAEFAEHAGAVRGGPVAVRVGVAVVIDDVTHLADSSK